MKRSVLQFVSAAIALMAATASSPEAYAATVLGTGTLSGVVRDSSGIPQIGAVVELLRADATIAATAYTDSHGRYLFAKIPRGEYAVKAMGTAFLPSLVEHIHVRSTHNAASAVNLTLNTLYEAMQWLPIQPRRHTPNQPHNDDWSWTLRASANRPLLRFLEDGPLILVSENAGAAPRLKARVVAEGGDAQFAQGYAHAFVDVEHHTAARTTMMSAGVNGEGVETAVGMHQQMGMGASFNWGVALGEHPELAAGGNQGVTMLATRLTEHMQVLSNLEAEAGSEQVMAALADGNTRIAALPFASVTLNTGHGELSYQLDTGRNLNSGAAAEREADDRVVANWLPNVAAKDGQLVIEHGLHQELAWEMALDDAHDTDMRVAVFGDHVEDPVIEAAGHLNAETNTVLADTQTGFVRGVGPSYSAAGVEASVTRRLPGNNCLRLSWANGDALVLDGKSEAALAQFLRDAHPRRSQMYSVALSGTVGATGTRWRTGYRWQQSTTLTAVAPFSSDGGTPYLSLQIRQPLHLANASDRIEVLVDMTNLLAEGYHAFLSDDGSRLYFAQDQRSLQAGLAFNF